MTDTRISNTHATIAKLGFLTSRTKFEELSSEASSSGESAMDSIQRLLEWEMSLRRAKQITDFTRLARFPFMAHLEDFDFNFQPSIDKDTIQSLASGQFIDHAENVVLLGPTGVGKTHLAVGLGLKAIEHGYTVRYTTLEAMIATLTRAEARGRLGVKLEYFAEPDLLIIDDAESLHLDKSSASLFHSVVSDRYEHGSIILTSPLAFDDWNLVMDNRAIAASIIDRLQHHATVIDIWGSSYRQRNKSAAELAMLPPAA